MKTRQRWIVIPRWDEFQHRDMARSHVPPWIKNLTRLLSDEAYLGLTPNRRALLHGLWLEYARTRRQLPDDTASISRRLAMKVTRADLVSLNHAGFVGFSASNPASKSAGKPAGLEVEREIEKPKPKTSPASPTPGLALVVVEPDGLKTVYDHWRRARGRTRANYDTITPKRRKVIAARLKRYSVDDLKRAIDGIACDPWDGRAEQDDLTIVFRSDEQVDKFMDLEERRPAAGGIPSADAMLASVFRNQREELTRDAG